MAKVGVNGLQTIWDMAWFSRKFTITTSCNTCGSI